MEELPYHPKDDPSLTSTPSSLFSSNSRLDRLPAELQITCLEWVLRQSDLASVCLVSKQLRTVAMPLLYRSVFIDVDQWSDEHLDKIFMRRHPGHLHIRTVDIDSTHLRSEEKALKVAKDALEVLPRDRLTSYR